jgi:hypothetical protein
LGLHINIIADCFDYWRFLITSRVECQAPWYKMDEASGVSANQIVEHRASGNKTGYSIARVCCPSLPVIAKGRATMHDRLQCFKFLGRAFVFGPSMATSSVRMSSRAGASSYPRFQAPSVASSLQLESTIQSSHQV